MKRGRGGHGENFRRGRVKDRMLPQLSNFKFAALITRL